jgi:hypothetical protein
MNKSQNSRRDNTNKSWAKQDIVQEMLKFIGVAKAVNLSHLSSEQGFQLRTIVSGDRFSSHSTSAAY